MKSMTGYGRGECTLYNRKFIAEIKSVNHRYNDISIKMPRAMISYEEAVKKILSGKIFRGKTDVYISFETYSKDDIKIKLNEVLTDSYVEVLRNIREKYNVKDDISAGLIAKFPEVLSVDKTIKGDGNDEIFEPLAESVSMALERFIEMRTAEGEVLKKDIILKLDGIFKNVKIIEERAPEITRNYQQRLTDRLNELRDRDFNFDEGRILTEVALFSEKACIDEEITRLFSHLAQMKKVLEENVPVGRKLDFIVQEMNREVNTIASKANDIDITNITVELKSEIEKIREQIQNIE